MLANVLYRYNVLVGTGSEWLLYKKLDLVAHDRGSCGGLIYKLQSACYSLKYLQDGGLDFIGNNFGADKKYRYDF